MMSCMMLLKNTPRSIKTHVRYHLEAPQNDFNIQRYYPGQGFKSIHCENNSKYDNTVLAWMFYLNTVEDGGTLFTSYD
ncbi:MAG: hypothetical protein CM15mV3_2200 [Caudoviricetes sp.]|nr:MAG: hypothetical protein CM15mV3_2200 [Caudoviricetes sp.]